METDRHTVDCMMRDRDTDPIPFNSVIPSEDGRSLVNDHHSRGTCFLSAAVRLHSDPTSALRCAGFPPTAGLSTPRTDSQASRFASLEMTILGEHFGTY